MNSATLARRTHEFHAAARSAELAKARRNDAIRQAYRAGMPTHELARTTELSPQRIAEIVAGDPNRPRRPTLHDAMAQVLRESGGGWMPTYEVAQEIAERQLYRRRDQGVVDPAQVRARAARYPATFEGSSDGTNRIRLR